MNKLIKYSIPIITITAMLTACQPPHEPPKELITYTYTITNITAEGYKGQSTKDDTGICFNNEDLQYQSIKEGETVKVYFDKNDYMNIKRVEVE